MYLPFAMCSLLIVVTSTACFDVYLLSAVLNDIRLLLDVTSTITGVSTVQAFLRVAHSK